jgi:hypothetical protein
MWHAHAHLGERRESKGKKSCDWHAINQNTKLEFATTWRDWLTPGRLSDYQVNNGVSTWNGIASHLFDSWEYGSQSVGSILIFSRWQ